MADEVNHLVIAPFREIVERANGAIENAQDAEEGDASAAMLKAAQSLAREGERALKRIEPLCTKYYEEYSYNFIDAIKEHDEIGQFRADLEELLWDFEDYIEVDQFNAEKFEELQKASRRAAPKIVDILKRMKLVVPPPLQTKLTSDEELPRPLARQRTTEYDDDDRSAMSPGGESVVLDGPSPSQKTMDEVEQKLSHMMGTQAGPDEGLEGGGLNGVGSSNSQRSLKEPPPTEPSTDPWRIGSPPAPVANGDQTENIGRASPVSPGDSPTLPLMLPLRPGNESNKPRHSPSTSHGSSSTYWYPTSNSNDRLRPDSIICPGPGPSSENKVSRHTSQSSDSNGSSARASRPASRTSIQYSKSTQSTQPIIPDDSAVNHVGKKANKRYPPRNASFNGRQNYPVRQPSSDSVNSSIFDCVPYEGASSPVASTQRTSSVLSSPTTAQNHHSSLPPQYPGLPPLYAPGSESHSAAGTTVGNRSSITPTPLPPQQAAELPSPPPRMDDPGLIPVDSETQQNSQMPTRTQDCTIGPYSSFYQMKGFCKGAVEATRGELGFKKIKRPVGGFSMTVVAKCNHCLFELDYRSVEQDLKNDASGTFTTHGVDFRLRILQKSHLKTSHVEEQVYGCVFCIQLSRTMDESDATVFFSQRQLFAHLARHPRPLPIIPGLTIIGGDADTPPPSHSPPPRLGHNNFDLRFPNPPVVSVMKGIAREVGRLPAAVAAETRKNAPHGGVLRSPPDRIAVLQFAVGARIVGIEFPERYGGRWGIGWHDGMRAAFEADSVRLDPPPRNEVRMQGTSNYQAVARWRWRQQGGEGNWLRFQPGEVIKNISWSYDDHWCWSGTSSKGWGIFPQSHIDHSTLKPVQPGDTSSVSSAEKKGIGRFSIRKPARIGGSNGNNGNNHSGPATPNMSY